MPDPRTLLASFLLAIAPLGTSTGAFAEPKRPAPPKMCTAPALPEPVATRFTQLGGIDRFGCAIDVAGPVYVFGHGRIEAIPAYGRSATYAAIVDASDVVHLYVSGTDTRFPVGQWLVRLTYDGSFVNQVKYDPGTGDVGSTYASNILVHPGGRHGTFEIATEGCFVSTGNNMLADRDCMGWSNAVFTMTL